MEISKRLIVVKNVMQKKSDIIVHTDGASRGNPGPAAIGVVLEGPEIEKKIYCECIGKATNNVAEYKAIIFGLKKIKQLVGNKKSAGSSVHVYMDSELIAHQLNGRYKVKESNIQELFLELWNLRLDFENVVFEHVTRDKNREADKMANYALDKEENKLL